MLLNPRNTGGAQCRQLKLNIDDNGPTRYFICQNWECSKPEISLDILAAKCSCGEKLSEPTNIISSMSTDKYEGKGGAFITETTSFIMTDDLHVITNMPTTVFELFEKSGSSDLHAVDEVNLNIGSKEMLTLLKFSLQSKSPLTDTFVSKGSNSGCLLKPSLVNYEIGNSSENESINLFGKHLEG